MMPEGPEVRTLVDQLQPAVGMRLVDIRFLSGRYVTHGPPVGFQPFVDTMTTPGKDDDDDVDDTVAPAEVDVVTGWNAKGKFIWITLDDHGQPDSSQEEEQDNNDKNDDDDFTRSIWITLGMSGRFLNDNHPKIEKARWSLRFQDLASGKLRTIYYHDTRNFGTMRLSLSSAELRAKLKSLGPDILSSDTDAAIFLEQVASQRNPKTNVCKFLMNQKKLSGVGNYILAECLYRANIDPFACLDELDRSQLETLFREIQETAKTSYAAKGVTRTGGSYRDVDGNEGEYGFQLQCYGREECPRGRTVLRDTNGPHGRTIWYVEDQLFVPRSARAEDGTIVASYYGTDGGDRDVPVATTRATHERDGHDPSIVGAAADNTYLTEETWTRALADPLSSETFRNLMEFVRHERAQNTVYPPAQDTFSALNLCPLDKVKVVIVGQDPYHGAGQGHGLAFSVRKGVPSPPSLRNVLKEVREDVGTLDRQTTGGNLQCWADQGVLLLNTVLTVQAGKANSHAKRYGWETFTDSVIHAVNEERDGVVFLLWGGPAAKKAAKVNVDRHVVIKTSHPSPLGATKTNSPFLGSRCFSRANAALIASGQDPIDWTVNNSLL